jgi:hypothetical protein
MISAGVGLNTTKMVLFLIYVIPYLADHITKPGYFPCPGYYSILFYLPQSFAGQLLTT